MRTDAPVRILAARGGALGDFLVTLPALHALAQRWPGAEIVLLTRPAWGRLAVACGTAVGWRSLESADAAPWFQAGAAVPADSAAWLASFDHIISWLPDADGAFAAQVQACGGPPVIQGPWQLTGPGPAAECLARLPAPHGLTLSRPWVHLPFPGPSGAFQVALHPGSGSPAKTWPAQKWARVLARLPALTAEAPLLLVTGEAEDAHRAGILRAFSSAGVPVEPLHAAELSVLARRLAGCGLFLGHDTGPAHLAAACGVPSLLLFGPTAPDVWAPPAPHVSILRAPGGDLSRQCEEIVWICLKNSSVGDSDLYMTC